VEVAEPEVQSHRRTEEVFARDDYRILYQFSGFTLNEYPFGQGRYSPNVTTTASSRQRFGATSLASEWTRECSRVTAVTAAIAMANEGAVTTATVLELVEVAPKIH